MQRSQSLNRLHLMLLSIHGQQSLPRCFLVHRTPVVLKDGRDYPQVPHRFPCHSYGLPHPTTKELRHTLECLDDKLVYDIGNLVVQNRLSEV